MVKGYCMSFQYLLCIVTSLRIVMNFLTFDRIHCSNLLGSVKPRRLKSPKSNPDAKDNFGFFGIFFDVCEASCGNMEL